MFGWEQFDMLNIFDMLDIRDGSGLLVCCKCYTVREPAEFRCTFDDPLAQVCDRCKPQTAETVIPLHEAVETMVEYRRSLKYVSRP